MNSFPANVFDRPFMAGFVVVLGLLFLTYCGPSNPDHSTKPSGDQVKEQDQEQTNQDAEQSGDSTEAEPSASSESSDDSSDQKEAQNTDQKPTLVYYKKPG